MRPGHCRIMCYLTLMPIFATVWIWRYQLKTFYFLYWDIYQESAGKQDNFWLLHESIGQSKVNSALVLSLIACPRSKSPSVHNVSEVYVGFGKKLNILFEDDHVITKVQILRVLRILQLTCKYVQHQYPWDFQAYSKQACDLGKYSQEVSFGWIWRVNIHSQPNHRAWWTSHFGSLDGACSQGSLLKN